MWAATASKRTPEEELSALQERVDAVSREHEVRDKLAEAHDKKFNRLVTAVGGIAAIGPLFVGGILWFYYAGGDSRERELKTQQQHEQLESAERRLDEHIQGAEERWDKIEKATIENQVLMVESIDHISDKLDRMSSKAVTETEPQVLTDARKAADKAKAREVLFRDD